MCCILGRMKNRNEESAIVRVYVHLYSDTERGLGFVSASFCVCVGCSVLLVPQTVGRLVNFRVNGIPSWADARQKGPSRNEMALS